MQIIDRFLNSITMYRLVLYYLIVLLIVALLLSIFNISLSFNPVSLLISTLFLVGVCWITNTIFARVYKIPTNLESVYISALILALLLTPPTKLSDFIFLSWAGILSMSSKYILVYKNKHIFNPVAVAIVLTGLGLNQFASWWVGNVYMLPIIIIGGILVVRKIRRFDLVWSFFFMFVVIIGAHAMLYQGDILGTLETALLNTPVFFFAFIMLTEPLTTPPTKTLQAIYGGIVGFLFSPYVHIGNFYTTPELALVFGNIFSFLVSPKQKLVLELKQIIKDAPDVYDFVFKSKQKLLFTPGQYLEWTLGHKRPDSRGNRRYFTIAASPTEWDLSIGVKFYPQSSSFKKALATLPVGGQIIASQLAGDFTLPPDPSKKLIFIAGGIGITPFRSMIKFLLDTQEKRDIVLFYSNKTADEISYKDIFDQAHVVLGIKVVYVLTDGDKAPDNWIGHVGYVDEKLIESSVPDYKERYYYISGPHSMVTAFQKELSKLGIPKRHIKTDFFPGFA